MYPEAVDLGNTARLGPDPFRDRRREESVAEGPYRPALRHPGGKGGVLRLPLHERQ